ncbi:MAG TPA: hypothetical protein VHH36_08490 [Candidatus Thermoplasmatota archaeon]|nr:hypothetical protein [Candidatus Thermoplasmatota archaeon]
MRSATAFLAALLIALPTAASACLLPPLVTVTLEIDATAYPLIPESKTCDVEVPEGSDGKVLLTAATAQGCIAGWTGSYFPGLGFFVDGVDGRRAVCDTPVWLVHCTFWLLRVNGDFAATGIDGWAMADGDVYNFTYDRSGAGLPAP